MQIIGNFYFKKSLFEDLKLLHKYKKKNKRQLKKQLSRVINYNKKLIKNGSSIIEQ